MACVGIGDNGLSGFGQARVGRLAMVGPHPLIYDLGIFLSNIHPMKKTIIIPNDTYVSL
jgi:hypothetical protein